MAPQLGWIGLGNMGRVQSSVCLLVSSRSSLYKGMCKNLVEKGDLHNPLIIFNRTVKRAEDLNAELPAGTSTVAKTIEEVVSRSEIIFTCLTDDAAVKETVATMMKGNVKEKLFVDCSTVHPDATEVLAKTIMAHSAQFVACPGR